MKPMKLPHPLNVKEQYLHAIIERLDAVIEQNNSIIDFISKTQDVAVTENKQVTKPTPRKRTKKTEPQEG